MNQTITQMISGYKKQARVERAKLSQMLDAGILATDQRIVRVVRAINLSKAMASSLNALKSTSGK
jgi:hypothetical protein